MPHYHITVKLHEHRLYLYDNNRLVHSYPVGVGRMLTKTPEGDYLIVNKQSNPGGPFGVFWLGLSKPHYGIHGTNNSASIGHDVSHGCIRMHNRDVLKLGHTVPIGTRVAIRQ